ncbi:MAG: hypothetical protein B6D61_11460 [Bacteroidetes bacterium 4484_249]|nr:MAG: hypothetical protein B6D61_11460 [Bacteroidetes bacterium 4484_249]
MNLFIPKTKIILLVNLQNVCSFFIIDLQKAGYSTRWFANLRFSIFLFAINKRQAGNIFIMDFVILLKKPVNNINTFFKLLLSFIHRSFSKGGFSLSLYSHAGF